MLENFDALKGQVLKSIKGKVGGDEIVFELLDGEKYELFHDQDCCESVYVEDIVGSLEDLVGQEILLAEEVIQTTNEDIPSDHIPKYQDYFQWTFYKLSTNRGSVTIRWHGESNGYYSVSVSWRKVPDYYRN